MMGCKQASIPHWQSERFLMLFHPQSMPMRAAFNTHSRIDSIPEQTSATRIFHKNIYNKFPRNSRGVFQWHHHVVIWSAARSVKTARKYFANVSLRKRRKKEHRIELNSDRIRLCLFRTTFLAEKLLSLLLLLHKKQFSVSRFGKECSSKDWPSPGPA